MTAAENGFEVRRIVVAIDSSRHAGAALMAAARLAARLHAELEGIYVQDINLARLAELPVGREIQFLTGRSRDFTAEALSAQNREQELAARRAIAKAAEQARITHGFRVAQGRVDVEVISAAGDADLLILGIGAQSPGGRVRLGQTARAAAERAPRSVLISKPGVESITTPLVCYDGSAGARRALNAALKISDAHGNNLTVLLIATDTAKADALRQEVLGAISDLRLEPRFLHGTHPTPEEICSFSTKCGADVLVISADSDLIAGADRLTILESIACPVLLVR